MNGATLRAGAAATLQRIKNPIQLARKILEHCPHMMLVAEGAERFAKARGIQLCKPEELVSEAEWAAWQKCKEDTHAAEHHRGHEQGTVGAVVIDANGSLFAATSTGGTCCKLPGRVGDSPLIGCGCYADSQAGGVSCTGYGEAIMKVVLAKTAVDLLRQRAICVDSPAASSSDTSTADLAAREAVHLSPSAPTPPAASSSSTATAIPASPSTPPAWPTATSPPTPPSSPPSSPVFLSCSGEFTSPSCSSLLLSPFILFTER